MKTSITILSLIASGLFIIICTNWIELELPVLDKIEVYEKSISSSNNSGIINSGSSKEILNSGSYGTVIRVVQKIMLLFVVLTFTAWVFMLLRDLNITKQK